MGKITKLPKDAPLEEVVCSITDDESEMSIVTKDLGTQIALLTKLMQDTNTRLCSLEKQQKSSGAWIKDNSKLAATPSHNEVVSSKYVMFERGDDNPKGGVYQFNHLDNVYLSDENKEAVIHDETRLYGWVLVNGETKTRRKLKHKLKRLKS